jgi:hypothetical protein
VSAIPLPSADGRPPCGARLAPPSGQQGRQQQHREQVGQDQAAAGRQHPGALSQPRPLVAPVIERGRADHQVEGRRGLGQPPGSADHETQPVISSGAPGDLDHGGRRVDPGQDLGLRSAGGQPAEQGSRSRTRRRVSASGWHAGPSQVRRAVGDLVMLPATPALVIALRALTERRDITITGYT